MISKEATESRPFVLSEKGFRVLETYPCNLVDFPEVNKKPKP